MGKTANRVHWARTSQRSGKTTVLLVQKEVRQRQTIQPVRQTAVVSIVLSLYHSNRDTNSLWSIYFCILLLLLHYPNYRPNCLLNAYTIKPMSGFAVVIGQTRFTFSLTLGIVWKSEYFDRNSRDYHDLKKTLEKSVSTEWRLGCVRHLFVYLLFSSGIPGALMSTRAWSGMNPLDQM